jgi:alpha-mannosidase
MTAAVNAALDRLRQLSQVPLQARWQVIPPTVGSKAAEWAEADWQVLPVAELNRRHHVAWAGGRQTYWLGQRLVIPADCQGYPIVGLGITLGLRWWADEAEIFVNGESVQTGDLFDCFGRISLGSAAQPGTVITLCLRLVSPGHDQGALVESRLFYESADWDQPEPGFIADELAVLLAYAPHLKPGISEKVDAAIAALPWEQVATPAFPQALSQLRQALQPWGDQLKQRQITCLGHAHLDLAWLWPTSDTWAAAERTFRSVLALQADFPELTYTHSSPALFDWLDVHRPELFRTIQQQVTAGRWQIDAGLWVEPELNLISGESIVRQILYGQRYCQAKFGQISTVAWLPDSFGFCHQLPQLLRQGGITCFATQKLRWNDANPFPHELFHWQAPDGSQILSLNLPPIGSDLDPVAIATYAAEWETKTGQPQALWLPGVGDHGGGPTRQMLLQARRWASSPLFPNLTFGHAAEFVAQVAPPPTGQDQPQPSDPPALPVWDDELYLELHRGCYTTHGDQKQANRHCERLLYQAELAATLAWLLTRQPYPQAELEQAWKQVLFNQFHDILPGTAIPEVFEDANRAWDKASKTGEDILGQALAAIAAQTPQPPAPQSEAQPLWVFNPLNWSRSELVPVALPQGQAWQVLDAQGQLCPSQVDGDGTLWFLATEIPAIGYRWFWLCPGEAQNSDAQSDAQGEHQSESGAVTTTLENPYFRMDIDPNTGQLSQIWDKRYQRPVLSGPGNQLQLFQDQGQYWDAWNLAPDYADHPLPSPQLDSLTWLETGPCRQRLRVTYRLNQSQIRQDYLLETHSPQLNIVTTIDWQETQVLLKAAFPLAVQADYATYETPFGAIRRPTNPQTPIEKAKWEVPALSWADLSDGNCDRSYGVSLLTDYKHGFDVTPSQLRLSLLKAPLWPDPGADRGHHQFTYALYPHAGDEVAAQTVRQAAAFNQPLRLVRPPGQPSQPDAYHHHSYLDLGDNSLVLSAFKLSEADPQQVILRCYESQGVGAELALGQTLGLQGCDRMSLLETQLPETQSATTIPPWQVATYRFRVGS